MSSRVSKSRSNNKKANLKRKSNQRSLHDRRRSLEGSGNVNSKRRKMTNRGSNIQSGSENSMNAVRHSSDEQSNQHHPVSNRVSTNELLRKIENLSEMVNRRVAENERRMCRLEVTVNKIFIMVGDLSGHTGPIDEITNDKGFEVPELPIKTTKELALLKRKLKDKDFMDFMVSLFVCLLYRHLKKQK